MTLLAEPEVNLAEIISRIVTDTDNERLRSFTSLLNTFNYAIQIQGGRNHWEPKDFRLFSISLAAMDQISSNVTDQAREKTVLRKVEQAMAAPSATQRLREM